jgi:hypothetical protein
MRLLCDEIIALVRREQYDYSRDAIQRLIDKREWGRLATRLCTDKALLRFLFASRDEVEYEDDFRCAIERLEKEHFDLILEVAGEPGCVGVYKHKGDKDGADDDEADNGRHHHVEPTPCPS